MCYQKEIQWQVIPNSLPTVSKYCKKCGTSTEFINSEKFRINANKSKLDVWMVYNCSNCGTSWNLTIYERMNPKQFEPTVYQGFMDNHYKLVKEYAFNRSIHQKNQVHLNLDEVELIIEGEAVQLSQSVQGETMKIYLSSDYDLDTRIDKLLAHKLGLSRQAIKRLCASKVIKTDWEMVRSKFIGSVVVELEV